MTHDEMIDFLVATMPSSNGSGTVHGLLKWREQPQDCRDLLGLACVQFALVLHPELFYNEFLEYTIVQDEMELLDEFKVLAKEMIDENDKP